MLNSCFFQRVLPLLLSHLYINLETAPYSQKRLIYNILNLDIQKCFIEKTLSLHSRKVPRIEEAFDSNNFIPSTVLDPNLSIHFKYAEIGSDQYETRTEYLILKEILFILAKLNQFYIHHAHYLKQHTYNVLQLHILHIQKEMRTI